ncbi:MAG: ParA family protein, partial [Roseomonas mucosa]|nr:ParA family protein [Roseomonas mucosa]
AAEAGFDPVLLDLDPQASAASWSDSRSAESPHVAAAQAARLPVILEAAKAQGCRLAVLDTAPNADGAALAAARASDLVLIPCRPSALDLRAIVASLRVAKELASKPAYVVINGATARSRLTQGAADALRGYGAQVCPVTLCQRQDFVEPMAGGLTATEWAPKGKAAQEMRQLWEWSAKQMGLKLPRQRPAAAKVAA